MESNLDPIAVLRTDNQVAREALSDFVAWLGKISRAKTEEEKKGLLGHHKGIIQPLEKYVNVQFRVEEEGLFPVLGNYIGIQTGPIHVMLIEHNNSKELFNSFKNALSGNNYKEAASSGNSFAALLSEHIEKEDHILLNMADMHLTVEEKAVVLKKIREISKTIN
jgi:Hemerythrin HHE cation binding domain.